MARLLLSIGLALPLALWVGIAGATAGEWREGIAVGGFVSKEARFGPQAGAFAAYGVLDALDLRLDVTGSSHPTSVERPLLLRIGGGPLYKFDVTRWVPYVGGSASYFGVLNRPGSGLLLEPFAGLDYLVSRGFGLALEYRLGAFVGESLDSPTHQLMFHFEYRSGW
jgi:hypothetical protein